MIRGNASFYGLLKEKNYLDIPSQVYCTDARTIPVRDNSVSLIVTSAPYVTSYEYADLHQLTALWLKLGVGVFELEKCILESDTIDQLIEYIEWTARLFPGIKKK